jgi:hypothetical protein
LSSQALEGVPVLSFRFPAAASASFTSAGVMSSPQQASARVSNSLGGFSVEVITPSGKISSLFNGTLTDGD